MNPPYLSAYLFVYPSMLIILPYSDSPEVIVPSNLLYSIWNEMEFIAGYRQQDAHEFILALLEGLERHLKVNHNIELQIPLSRANSPLLASYQAVFELSIATSPRRNLRSASISRDSNCAFIDRRIAAIANGIRHRDRSSNLDSDDDLLIEDLIKERPPDVVENLHDVSPYLHTPLNTERCLHRHCS